MIFRNFRNTARVGKSDVSDEVVRRLAKADAKFEDVAALVSGAAGKEVLKTGNLDGGMFWAGMVQGLIHDIPTVQKLINDIMSEADSIISKRLRKMSA